MSRGLIIDSIHTYQDWGLILTAQEMEPPKIKTKYLDIPLGDGSIDLTEAIIGDVSFEDRKGTFEFDLLVPPENREGLIAAIGSYIHGKKRSVTLPDDLDHFYYGRMALSSVKAQGMVAKIEMEILCDPYRYKNDLTTYSGTVGAGGSASIVCANSRKRVIPKITVSANATIGFKGSTYSVNAGTWQLTNIIFVEGQNTLSITAAAGTTYAIEYQEGEI